MCLVGACGGAASSTPEVALTIDVDSSVSNEALGLIDSLVLHATGNETYDHTITPSRPLQREERLVYDASAATRAVTIELDALDQLGHVVASGAVGPIALQSRQRTTALLTLSASALGVDMAQADLPSYPAAVLADSPLTYYRLDEPAGPIAGDSSGNGRTATYQSTVAYGQAGVVAGDSAIKLQADDASVLTNDAAAFSFAGRAPFSLELWVNPPAIDGNYHLLFNWDEHVDNQRQHYGIYMDDKDGMVLERIVDDTQAFCASALPAVGKWSHIVGTYDGSTLTLYMNGVPVCTASDARAFTTDTQQLYIANAGPGWHAIDATFDEAAVYGTALSAARVLAHYEAAR